ncbi:unannotated protein [freshwater metagenome]|uniref:Unannotated protein n=1 Tax=freshwater metagenome TaxID=449393 RepID=A0A6J7HQY6_9ZZZZ|nr:hypothetical protein [Actinomycetota bacterium]
MVVLFAATPASARSIHDPDIGWSPALRRSLDLPALRVAPCRARTTKAKIRLQSRVADREPSLRGILRYGEADVWGSSWYTNCDGGRLQIGIAGGAPAVTTRRIVRTLRRALDRRGLTRDVRLVAVRSTYKQLDTQADAVEAIVPGQLEAGNLSTSIDTVRNAVEIEAYNTLPATDVQKLRAFARDAPVNVVVHVEPPADPGAPVPTYEASVTIDRRAVRRGSRQLPVSVDDATCFADESYDSAQRFVGVRVRRARHAWILAARFRVNPDWPRFSTCVGSNDPRLTVKTTVTLPSALGRRGIVDGTKDSGTSRGVILEPVGATAIRSLVPRFTYTGATCDQSAVRRAFRGRSKSTWCFL